MMEKTFIAALTAITGVMVTCVITDVVKTYGNRKASKAMEEYYKDLREKVVLRTENEE